MPRVNTASRKKKPDSTSMSFGELGELLGYQLRRAQGAVHRDFMSSIEGLEVTQKQTAILWLIQINPGISQVDIAIALGMDRPTMMGLTDRLESRGFVTRARSTVDRRRQELHLTAAGRAALAKLKKRIAKHEQRMHELFTPEELDQLLGSLRKLQTMG